MTLYNIHAQKQCTSNAVDAPREKEVKNYVALYEKSETHIRGGDFITGFHVHWFQYDGNEKVFEFLWSQKPGGSMYILDTKPTPRSIVQSFLQYKYPTQLLQAFHDSWANSHRFCHQTFEGIIDLNELTAEISRIGEVLESLIVLADREELTVGY